MTIDYADDRDDESAVSDDDIVSVEKCYLACLMRAAEEQVDFEDHGDFVVVLRGDLRRLRRMAYAPACEIRSEPDDS